MEAQFAERLRLISHGRKQIILKLQQAIPALQFLETNWVFHSILFFTATALIISVFRVIRSLTIFSFHPLCMIIGTFIFIGEGVASYRNHSLLEAFSPIMQHNKRMKVRAIHQAAQTTGAIFIFLGMMFILLHKTEIQHDVMPHSVHSIIACVTMALILVQIVSGKEKFDHYLYTAPSTSSSQSKIRRWHGDLGLLLWDMLCITVMSGLVAFLPMTFTSLIVITLPCLVWLVVVLQIQGRVIREEEEAATRHPNTTMSGGASSGGGGLGASNMTHSTSSLDLAGAGGSSQGPSHSNAHVAPMKSNGGSSTPQRKTQRKKLSIEDNVDYDSQEEILYAEEDEEEFDEMDEEEESTEVTQFLKKV